MLERMTTEEIKALAIGNEWQRIEFDLNEEELLKVEKEYTESCLEVDQLKTEKKSQTDHFGSLIKNADTRREDLRQMLMTKKRKADTNVYLVPDHDREVMCFYDIKTGLKVKERPLEHWERQNSALEDFADLEETETEDAETAA